MNSNIRIGVFVVAFSGFAQAHPLSDQPEVSVLAQVKPSSSVLKVIRPAPKRAPKQRAEILKPLPVTSDTGNYGVSIVPSPQNPQLIVVAP
jgi:hypothetical protein